MTFTLRSAAATFVVLFVTTLTARPAAAQPECAGRWADDGLNFAGRLTGGEIRGHLHLGFPAEQDNGVSGVFFYPEKWTPTDTGVESVVSLTGTLTDDCRMQLTDAAGGKWRLHLVASGRLEGTREDPEGRSRPLTLRRVSETNCSGRGNWRTFDSPQWPITFSYPASWRLAVVRNEIVIACPDAARLAQGDEGIRFELGRGRETVVADDGRRGIRIDRFLTFDKDKWLVGDTCEKRPPADLGVYCRPARMSTWREMTVLQGSAGEDRRYRPGGGHYLGQGGGAITYLFLLGDAWVSIHGRDTAVLSGDDLEKSGPVIFEGNGVTERIVRTIRRR